MQLDMHYYGTYAMARAAGIKPDTAKIIATSAQFVDDNVASGAIEFENAARIDSEATAHHTLEVRNLDPHDQRRVWVPFHFLPGNVGTSYRDRLKCRKNSEPAKKMIEHHLVFSDREFAPELMGIGAHVYADTFSHYGFSGVSSRGNRIDNSTISIDERHGSNIKDYITKKAGKFFGKYADSLNLANIKASLMGGLAETASGALGHGAVATYPDRPYLEWRFQYEEDDAEAEGRWSRRNNLETFFEGCRALHGVFERFAQANGGKYGAGDGRQFSEIADAVKTILALEGEKNDRIKAWQDAAREGKILGAEAGESIPDYDGESWNSEWQSFNEQQNYDNAIKSRVWQFYRAAAIHRTYVLRDLLPSYGLVVD